MSTSEATEKFLQKYFLHRDEVTLVIAMNSISEDQKRWLVVGIAFNKLVPQIRPSVEQSLQAEYQRLKSSNNIHVQTAPGPILRKHPKNLKYENINSNSNHKVHPGKFDFSKFDYKVASHVDFAKLYVQPFMAKFNAFDGRCDGSAVLLLLGEVPVFPPVVQAAAKSVKDNVRNEWAHCNFTDWDAAKFQSSFQELRNLVQSIGLPTADEANLVSGLNDWETKGTTFCGNSPVDPSLLSLVRNEVLQLSSNLDDFVCQYKEQKDQLVSQIQEIKQSLEQRIERVEHKVQTLEQRMDDLSSHFENTKKSVSRPTFFGALDRNEYFTGRKKELETLGRVLGDTSPKPDVPGTERRRTKIHGICGLGGCGKSSLALEFAWQNVERYPGGVFVVNGESDELMRASLQGIYGEFVENKQSDQKKEAKPFDQVLNETLSWLGNLRERWLLLVDNLDQKELSHCATKIFFGQWKSKTCGDILVTSRRSSGVLSEDLDLPAENCSELDPFSVEESIEFLRKRTGILSSCDDVNQAEKELAQELGGLPLALEQASAYIKALNCSIELYLQHYRSQKSKLLNLKRAKPRSEIYSVERLAVQTTWLLNFSYIENEEKDQELGKAAASFMKIAAFLPPDEIPIEVLNPGAPEIEDVDLKKRLVMPVGAEQIVDLLIRFSLFKRKSNDTLSVHRLVQETLREHCDGEGETDNVLNSAVRMVHKTFLKCVGGTDFFSDLYKRLTLQPQAEKRSTGAEISHLLITSSRVPLEAKSWKKLSVSAFHLVYYLLRESSLKPRFFSEESARLFCEAAYYCYSVGKENEGLDYQQFALEIICAVNKPIRCYKDEELQKITRILGSFSEPAVLRHKLMEASNRSEIVSEEAAAPIDTTHGDELLQAIKVMEPKAREAFSRGDFQTSVELYTDIVQMSNFNPICGSFRKGNRQPHLVPLGEILCHRGIAHLKMKNFETAVDDFNSSTYLNTEHYRAFYWKAYALSKLAESGKTEFTSRAQAATALLYFKFSDSKSGDISKLRNKFSGLLHRIYCKLVHKVADLKELEKLPPKYDSSNDSLTIILSGGCFNLDEMYISGGRFYFVCPPGGSATLNCIKGVYLREGSFMFENVQFINPLSLNPEWSKKDVEEICASMNLDTLYLGRPHRDNMEPTGGTGKSRSAFIEADDVHSLVIEHCDICYQPFTGIAVNYDDSYRKKGSVSVRSSKILCCSTTGLRIQGNTPTCHFSFKYNVIRGNLYGVVVDCLSHFCLDGNDIFGNALSGVVAIGTAQGKLRRNVIAGNRRHGILLKAANAVVEENEISNNSNWGIVCSLESSLQCIENVFEKNLCGGLRIMLNGERNVLVQRCHFSENRGPSVFPASEDELRQLHFASTPGTPLSFYVVTFLEFPPESCIPSTEFTSPVLLDNKVSEVSNSMLNWRQHLCCTCHKELDSDLIECPNCRIARYCGEQCYTKAIAVHGPVCKSVLKANKEHGVCQARMLSKAPQPSIHQDRDRKTVGISMCVVATFAGLRLDLTDFDHFAGYHWCFLMCPKQNVWTVIRSEPICRWILDRGVHLPDRMTNIKAACVLANFDSESGEIDIYDHRIFPIDTVSDSLTLVDKVLNLVENEILSAVEKASSL